MKNGIIILDKGEHMTSQSAVNRVKHLFGAAKAGHTGTLDPDATGVLPILIGNAVKAGEYMLSSEKHYLATLTLGVTTDTEDLTGTVLTRSDEIPDESAVLTSAASFLGESMQTPPMYSALKIGGKKLCDLARAGVEVDRTPRPILITKLDVRRVGEREYALEVICSKGTYIRTLCADIGRALGCGAAMSSLRRAGAAGFTLSDAYTLDRLCAMSEEEREACVLPVETVFKKWRAVSLPPFFARLAHNGLPIYQKKIAAHIREGEWVRLYDDHGFFAVACSEISDGEPVLRPKKQFPQE